MASASASTPTPAASTAASTSLWNPDWLRTRDKDELFGKFRDLQDREIRTAERLGQTPGDTKHEGELSVFHYIVDLTQDLVTRHNHYRAQLKKYLPTITASDKNLRLLVETYRNYAGPMESWPPNRRNACLQIVCRDVMITARNNTQKIRAYIRKQQAENKRSVEVPNPFRTDTAIVYQDLWTFCQDLQKLLVPHCHCSLIAFCAVNMMDHYQYATLHLVRESNVLYTFASCKFHIT